MKARLQSIRLVWLALAAVMLAACSPPTTTIDGQEVGRRVCAGAGDEFGEPMCGRFVGLARNQLDREHPRHAAIHDIGVYLDPAFVKNGGVYGYWVVVVLRLDDDAAAAYRVHCNAVSPEVGCPPELTIQRKGASPPVGRP
jgi:hypothetical protein